MGEPTKPPSPAPVVRLRCNRCWDPKMLTPPELVAHQCPADRPQSGPAHGCGAVTGPGAPCCDWCGASDRRRELVPVADGHACTVCWDSDDLGALRRLLAARVELDAALTVCGVDPHTGALTEPGRDTREAVRYLGRVTDRPRYVAAQARKEVER